MNNLFKKAIEQNTLLEFALGKDEFFIQDPELNEHWELGAWKYHVVPLVNEDRNTFRYVVEMFASLAEAGQMSLGARIDHLLNHIHVFRYFCLKKELQDCDDLFERVEDLAIPTLRNYCEAVAKSGDQSRLKQVVTAVSVIQKKGGLKQRAIETTE